MNHADFERNEKLVAQATRTSDEQRRIFTFSILNNVFTKSPWHQPLHFSFIATEFLHHRKAAPNLHENEVKSKQNVFLPALFSGNSHQARYLWRCNVMVLDYDQGADVLFEALKSSADLNGWAYLWYTSANHGVYAYPKRTRLRLIFLLNSWLSSGLEGAAEYTTLHGIVNADLEKTFGCRVDPSSAQVTQPYTYGIYNPAATDAPTRGWKKGRLLNVAEMLKPYRAERAALGVAKDDTWSSMARPVKKRTISDVVATRGKPQVSSLAEVEAALDYIEFDELEHRSKHAVLVALFTGFGDDAHDAAKTWYGKDDAEFERQWKSAQVPKDKAVGLEYIFKLAILFGYTPGVQFLPGVSTKAALRNYVSNISENWDPARGEFPENPHHEIIGRDIASAAGTLQASDKAVARYFGTGNGEFDFTFLWIAARTSLHPDELVSLPFASEKVQDAFKRRFAAYRERRLSYSRLSKSAITKTIPENHFFPEHRHQVNVSAMGSKKSENIIPEVISYANERGWGVLVLGNRVSTIEYTHRNTNLIAAQAGYDWKTTFYKDVIQQVTTPQFDYLLCVINSLAHPRFSSFLQRKLIVVMDEFAQVLATLVYGKFTGKDGSVEAVTLALRNVLRSAEYVVCMDASATQFYIDLLKELLGVDDIPVYAVEAPVLSQIEVRYGWDSGGNSNSRDRVIERMVYLLNEGQQFMAAFESRKKLYDVRSALELLGKKQKRYFNISTFTSDPTVDRKRFLEDSRQVFDSSSAFLFSPALTSGISNKNPAYEDTLAIFGGEVLTAVDLEQMLFRDRPVKRMMLALRAQYRKPDIDQVRFFYKQPDLDGAILHASISDRIQDYRRVEMDHNLRTLLWRLEERGAKITRMQSEKKKISASGIRLEDGKQANMHSVLNARALEPDEYEVDRKEIEAGAVASRFEPAELEAHGIRRVFKLRGGANAEPISDDYYRLYYRDQNLATKFQLRACLVGIMEANEVRRFSQPKNACQYLYRPMLRLWQTGLNQAESSVLNALEKGTWTDDLNTTVAHAIKAAKAELENRSDTALLVPKSFANLKNGSRLTDAQIADAAKRFKKYLVPRAGDAQIWLEATRRWMKDLEAVKGF